MVRIARTGPRMLAVALLAMVSTNFLLAQTTVGTGRVVGAVNDPSGAVIRSAKIKVTNTATAQVIELATNSSGSFNSGALIPGNYKVQISAVGFGSLEVSTIVLLGNTSTVNVTLQIGPETHVVEVQSSEIRVNTEQPTVQGVLDEHQIENLPVK